MEEDATIRLVIGFGVDEDGNPKTHQYDREQVSVGFELSKNLAQKDRVPFWIVTSDIRQLDAPEITNSLGDGFAKALKNRKVASVGPGQGVVQFCTPGMRNVSPRGVVLAIYPDQSVFTMIYRNPEVQAEIVVPWQIGPVHDWSHVWGASQLVGDNLLPLPQLEITDPDVRRAVDDALRLSGLTHPNDIERARKSFAKLRKQGKQIDGPSIRAYALRITGFGVGTAEDLVKIAIGRPRAR